jgi:hypothetical protein
MAHSKLYAYRLTVYEASSATNTARVPSAGIAVYAQKRGAFAQGAGNDNAGAGATITVHNINSIAAGDTIWINNNTVSRTVASVTATTIVTAAGAASTFEWVDGDRIRSSSATPQIFTDAEGVENIAGGTTDSNGEVEFYSKVEIMDVLLIDGTTYTLLPDIAGDDGQEHVRPEDWGARGDGSTNDAAAFTDMIEYLTALAEPAIVHLAPRSYRLGSAITVNALTGLHFAGADIGATIFEINHAGTGFDLTGAATDVSFSNLTFKRLSGSGDAVQLGSSVVRPRLQNVAFLGGGIGVDDNGSTDLRMLNTYFTGSGTWVSFVSLNAAKRAHITDMTARPESNWTRGIDVDTGCANVRLTNVDITPVGGGGIALHLRDSGASTDPRDTIATACHLQGGTTAAAVTVDAGQGMEFNGCTVEGSLIGYDINGGTGIRINGGEVVNIQQDGVDIDGGSYICMNATHISDISQAGADTYNGVDVLGTVSNVYLFNLILGNHLRAAGTTWNIGIDLNSGAGDNITVLGVSGDPSAITGAFINNGKTISASKNLQIAHNPLGAGEPAKHSPVAFDGVLSLSNDDTTPDVGNIHWLQLSYGVGITITGFENPQVGQTLIVYNAGANTITLADTGDALVANTGNLFMSSGGASDIALSQGDVAIFRAVPGGTGGIPNVYWTKINHTDH